MKLWVYLAGAAFAMAFIGGVWLHGFTKGKEDVQAKWDAAETHALAAGVDARSAAERDILNGAAGGGSPPRGPSGARGVCNDRFDRDCH